MHNLFWFIYGSITIQAIESKLLNTDKDRKIGEKHYKLYRKLEIIKSGPQLILDPNLTKI